MGATGSATRLVLSGGLRLTCFACQALEQSLPIGLRAERSDCILHWTLDSVMMTVINAASACATFLQYLCNVLLSPCVTSTDFVTGAGEFPRLNSNQTLWLHVSYLDKKFFSTGLALLRVHFAGGKRRGISNQDPWWREGQIFCPEKTCQELTGLDQHSQPHNRASTGLW